jgi:hypothetical protein
MIVKPRERTLSIVLANILIPKIELLIFAYIKTKQDLVHLSSNSKGGIQ